MASTSSKFRSIAIPLQWLSFALFATALVMVGASAADAKDAPAPRLLDGARFWIGDPLKQREADGSVRITAIAFTPDGNRVIAGKENGLLMTIDVSLRRMIGSNKAHESSVDSIVFRPGKPSYFTAGKDHWIREWNTIESDRLDFRSERPFRGVMAISPDGKVIGLGGSGDQLGRYDSASFHDARSGKQMRAVRDQHGADCIAFSPDSKSLLSIENQGNHVQLWDVASGKLTWSRTEDRAYPGNAIDVPFLSGCAFGPAEDEYTVSIDGPWGDATVCIYALTTGAMRKKFISPQGHIKFAISPDRQLLAIGGYQSLIDLWDLKTGKRVQEFYGEQDRIWCLAFSPDSCLLASGGGDGTVIVWNVPIVPKRDLGPKRQT